MQALTTNYGDISEQVNVFKNSNKLVAIEADGGEMAGDDLNKNLVSFNLNFTILKNIFIE